jgi:uncharacterized membrane protein YeiH
VFAVRNLVGGKRDQRANGLIAMMDALGLQRFALYGAEPMTAPYVRCRLVAVTS